MVAIVRKQFLYHYIFWNMLDCKKMVVFNISYTVYKTLNDMYKINEI